ncbi:MAG: four helix bundle protein [Bacteroidota bacterium]
MNHGFKNLDVYSISYQTAIEVFKISKTFPKEETYSLTDQIRRSSRSVCANLAEGYRKRVYPKHFVSKMTDADAECSETLVWLDFSLDCGYIDRTTHLKIKNEYEKIGRMIGSMIKSSDKFIPKHMDS